MREPDVRLRYVIDPRTAYKVSDVAKMLDVSVGTVRKWILLGDLLAIDTAPAGKTRASWRITKASFDAFFTGHAYVPPGHLRAAAGGRR